MDRGIPVGYAGIVRILGTSQGLPAQTGPWDNSKEWESQGLSRDSSPLKGTWDSPMGNRTSDGKLGHEWRLEAILYIGLKKLIVTLQHYNCSYKHISK